VRGGHRVAFGEDRSDRLPETQVGQGTQEEQYKEVTDFSSAARSDTSRHAAYFHRMLERGDYLPPSQFEACFVSLAHGREEIEKTIEAARESLKSLFQG